MERWEGQGRVDGGRWTVEGWIGRWVGKAKGGALGLRVWIVTWGKRTEFSSACAREYGLRACAAYGYVGGAEVKGEVRNGWVGICEGLMGLLLLVVALLLVVLLFAGAERLRRVRVGKYLGPRCREVCMSVRVSERVRGRRMRQDEQDSQAN